MSTRAWFATVLPILLSSSKSTPALADVRAASEAPTIHGPAAEQPDARQEHLGRRGQVIITSGTQLDFRRSLYGNSDAGVSAQDSVALSPSLDYLILDHFSMGASIGIGMSRPDEGLSGPNYGFNDMFFSVAPRAGYQFALGSGVLLWPQIQVAYRIGQTSSSGFSQWTVGASVPVVVELTTHFFVGAGPDFNFASASFGDAGNNVRYSSSGITTMLGGWI